MGTRCEPCVTDYMKHDGDFDEVGNIRGSLSHEMPRNRFGGKENNWPGRGLVRIATANAVTRGSLQTML